MVLNQLKMLKLLGGIVTIRVEDFEKTNGFLNLWTWGLEDNALLKRCMREKIGIDYSSFNEIKCEEVIMFNSSKKTRVTNNDYSFENFHDKIDKNYGFQTIKNLNYSFENIRENAYFC